VDQWILLWCILPKTELHLKPLIHIPLRMENHVITNQYKVNSKTRDTLTLLHHQKMLYSLLLLKDQFLLPLKLTKKFSNYIAVEYSIILLVELLLITESLLLDMLHHTIMLKIHGDHHGEKMDILDLQEPEMEMVCVVSKCNQYTQPHEKITKFIFYYTLYLFIISNYVTWNRRKQSRMVNPKQ